ncbi:mobilization protein [Pedobacter sp. KBW06]|uniref:plasmid mobilization protein n=1 Tax=Pedobacter sp. KBW06 TaxID=2153359 RepID=UPI000F5A8B42|nr:mobilization protein [Pedobacter sp. KBW06]RQO74527.1 mobilization protein [Pedobacter sp. KBW06]
MSRKKVREQDSILSHTIVIRITAGQYKKLDKISRESAGKTIAYVVRKIIANKPITLLHKDISMSEPMEELALIRKEIKSIGVNINQQTHKFHISQSETERTFHINKTAETYKAMEPKIDRLLTLVSNLALKWLQK